jgi:hypothetical protein
MSELALRNVFARRPLVAWPAVWYSVFVLLTVVAVRKLLFLWPYPFVLCLQKWIGTSLGAFVLAWGFGLCAIICTGALAQKIAGPRRPGAAASAFISLVTSSLPLALVTAFAWIIAEGLGWPIGE